jgi:hypothetical protein
MTPFILVKQITKVSEISDFSVFKVNPPKSWYVSTCLRDVTSHKTIIVIFTYRIVSVTGRNVEFNIIRGSRFENILAAEKRFNS